MKKLMDENKKPILRVIYIFLGLFTLMIAYFSYFIIVESNEVINNVYNKRHDVLAERITRGQILSLQGDVLARTVTLGGKEVREYPYGSLFAHVVGRYEKGRSGLEELENIRLLTSHTNALGNMYQQLIGEKNPGDNVVTTLNLKIQQAASDALGNNRGAVVVLEPSTGKILAMVSKPDYDPNEITTIWPDIVEDSENESRLLNRATQGLYPPGSTYKLVTALAYMRQHPSSYMEYEYECKGHMEYEGMTIRCYNNKVHGKVDLVASFAKSCNTSFAHMASQLDLEQMYGLNESLLFNRLLPLSMPNNPSSYLLRNFGGTVKETMQTGIGQGRTLMTPMHNAMITATVANGGVMMKPYLIDRISNANGSTIDRYQPEEYAVLMTEEEATFLAGMMRSVVTDGTATKLKDLPVESVGKTGSAEQANKPAHAWYIGYAPYENPQIVVSIIVESKGSGSEYAVPIARSIFEAYFNIENE